MLSKQRIELDKGEDYWFFSPKLCAAYQEMTANPKEEVSEVPKDLKEAPLSTLVAIKGIKSSDDLIDFLGALMADVSIGSVPCDDAMACLSIADKIVDVARFSMSQQSSTRSMGSARPLTLSGGE